MKATTLKKKYPELWKAVYSNVMFDCRRLIEDYEHVIDKVNAEVIAHNAAFVACSEHHKILKTL